MLHKYLNIIVQLIPCHYTLHYEVDSASVHIYIINYVKGCPLSSISLHEISRNYETGAS